MKLTSYRGGARRGTMGPPLAGHRRWPEPQACLQARSLPCSRSPVHQPPPGLASLHATPTPYPPLPHPHPGIHNPCGSNSGVQPFAKPPQQRPYPHGPTVSTSGPPPSLCPSNVSCGAKLRMVGCFFIFGSLRLAAAFQPAPALPRGEAGSPLEVAGGGYFSHAHPSQDCLVQFPVSGKLCFLCVTDG